MAANYTSASSNWYLTQSTNTVLGGLIGGAMSGLGNYQNQQNAYNQLVNINYATVPAPAPVRKSRGFIAELREEIDAWHGDILGA